MTQRNTLLEKLRWHSRRWWSMDGYTQRINEYNREHSETAVPYSPLDGDEWQKFKRDFVKTYGGETVKHTGMTNSELLDYIATGYREGDDDHEYW